MTVADKTEVLRYIRRNVDQPVEGAGVPTAQIAQQFSLSPEEALAVTEELIHDLEINREGGVEPMRAKLFPAD
jgi:hypothetical protein